MNTIPPTMSGTACLSHLNGFMYPSQAVIVHNNPKRYTEAKPKIIRPIQNTIVFSPSNTLNHHDTITGDPIIT